MNTQGHVGSQGGLRGHSVGPLYPWSVVGFGDDTWQATNLITGAVGPRRLFCQTALWDAELAATGCLSFPVQEPVDPYRHVTNPLSVANCYGG